MCVCVPLCTNVVHKTAQNSSEKIITAQMMFTGEEGDGRGTTCKSGHTEATQLQLMPWHYASSSMPLYAQ